MFDQIEFAREFFVALEETDAEIVQQVQKEGCQVCGARLYRSDFERKPRGALMAAAGEEFATRFSLCCGREGCRKRATPPSVRFLGRRVYLGAVVIVASVVAQVLRTAETLGRAREVPAGTVRRWQGWWKGAFLRTEVFMALRARLIGIAVEDVPASIVRRLGEPGDTPEGQVRSLLTWLKPLTKGTGVGSRMLGDIG
jgi:hypothetical protein